MPRNRLAPTARPSRLQPVRPNRLSGASPDQPNGPSLSHCGASPRASYTIGSNSTQAQAANPTTIPAIAARAGVCGRHTANASAGARVASAENETAPTSASASLPAISRL